MLVSGHSWAQGWAQEWTVPSKAALFQAGNGWGPCRCSSCTPGSHNRLRRRDPRVTSTGPGTCCPWDGLCLDLPDTDENVERFGRPRPPAATAGAARSRRSGPRVGRMRIPRHHRRRPGLVQDRGTNPGRRHPAVAAPGSAAAGRPRVLQLSTVDNAAATGADLLWRIKSNAVLPVESRYPDGSFASHVYPGTTARRNKTDGIAVRVIEYHLDTAIVAPRSPSGIRCRIADLPPAHHHPGPRRGPGRRAGRPVFPTLGDRDSLRRTEDPPTRRGVVLRSNWPTASSRRSTATCACTTPSDG